MRGTGTFLLVLAGLIVLLAVVGLASGGAFTAGHAVVACVLGFLLAGAGVGLHAAARRRAVH